MNCDIKISIIVPAYNAERWIIKCIDSIINQTYSNLEIIVINDGSTDSTAKIIKEYTNKDNRILAIHQENKGLVATRDVGISVSTGAYVGFVDADDEIELDMYAKLLKNIIAYDADIAHCGMVFCYEDGRKEFHYGTGEVVIQDNFRGQVDLLEGTMVEPTLCTKLYKRELLIDSCLDTSVLNNEDLLRNFVLFQRAKKSVFEDFCGYKYMQHMGSMSKDIKRQVDMYKHILRARKKILENSTHLLKTHAMRTWLSAVVNAVNALNDSKEQDAKEMCNECRRILIEEHCNLKYLIARQRLAAYFIILSLPLHKVIYGIYQGKRRCM